MTRSNRHIIVGTAGHVDHGKTELVKALTGVNTDRLKEEQERGISIELGFAELELPSGDKVGLVDVPGHERFVKAMVAGAAGMDLGMLIVAADESVMPQTREHLDILSLLELQGGVVVITKSDLADEETLEVVEAEVEDLVRGTFLEAAPVVRVSARDRTGLDDLRAALETVTGKLPPRSSDGVFRLPVDRAFTLAGVGLLVTGTAWSGRIQEGEAVVVLPPGLEARVRSIQVHGEKRQAAVAGERVALNLHGPKSSEVLRGMLVATPGGLRPSYMLDVVLRLLPDWVRPVANRTRVRIHHGASEILGRVVLLDRDALEPGQSAPAQLRLEAPLAADRGDRLVLRQYSPMHTLGGAVVLDPVPTKHKRFRADVLEAMALKESGGSEDLVLDAIRRAAVSGATPAELGAERIVPEDDLGDALDRLAESGQVKALGETWYEAALLERLIEEVRRRATEFQRVNPLAWGIGRAELQERLSHRGTKTRFAELLEGLARMTAESDRPIHLRPDAVRVGSADRQLADADRLLLERLEAMLREAGAAPPLPAEMQAKLGLASRFPAFVSLLEEKGTVIKVADGLYYHRTAFAALESKLRTYLATHPVMSMGDFKELTGLSRKYSVPLLEFFDRRGITSRQGDNRVPGPRH
jgi:selenocysteine-specific elongation factor